MQPLPAQTYERSLRVSSKEIHDYLIVNGLNKYSVPYDPIGENVNIKLTNKIVAVFYVHTRDAANVRLEK